ncbi:MAG TPA: hypothetical protein VE219_04765, partial [Candidatus Sulfotelmatobacter sp.]|nr:hypothetical protein [Candidatus Sulfotelmatobacter sp.]
LEIVVKRPGTDPLSAGDWRGEADDQGGILGDHAVHYLSLCHQVDDSAQVVACHRCGAAGRETAEVAVALGAGGASITLSYASTTRHNSVRLSLPGSGRCIAWVDDMLTVAKSRGGVYQRRVRALSDRRFVNELYSPMYRSLFDRIDDSSWRARCTGQTLAVARLLSDALSPSAQFGSVAPPLRLAPQESGTGVR